MKATLAGGAGSRAACLPRFFSEVDRCHCEPELKHDCRIPLVSWGRQLYGVAQEVMYMQSRIKAEKFVVPTLWQSAFVPQFLAILIGLFACVAHAADDVTYANWTSGVTKHDVVSIPNRHVIHSYYSLDVESPDGRYILFYTSGTKEGEDGDLRILERSTGKQTIIAENIHCEDAHRVACQQWANGGKTVVYHDCRQGKWVVVAVDIATLRQKILAEDRQLGFGASASPYVPIYGCHWNPGTHRDLELVNFETGEIKTALTIASVIEKYGDWTRKRFKTDDLSICFPWMSPDGTRVFCKVGHPGGGNSYRGMNVTDRDGKVIYDLEKQQFLGLSMVWGHPSWTPDNNSILEKGNFITNVITGKSTLFGRAPTDHPTMSSNGKVFATDGQQSEKEKEWVVLVGSTNPAKNNQAPAEYTIIDKFDNSKGATSWRHNHPHPVFSADGKRLYYNVNDGQWTRLVVAEVGNAGAP